MALDLTASFGTERLARQIAIHLHASLNAELALVQTQWDALDDDFIDRTGQARRTVTLEPVERRNIYLGHTPSLIEAPVDRYPNVSVMAYEAGHDEELQTDHYAAYTINVFAEVMCKSEFDEQEVNARIQRTTDAVNRIVMADRTLGGLVTALHADPIVEFGDVILRKEDKGHGTSFMWQGARLEWAFRKVSSFK